MWTTPSRKSGAGPWGDPIPAPCLTGQWFRPRHDPTPPHERGFFTIPKALWAIIVTPWSWVHWHHKAHQHRAYGTSQIIKFTKGITLMILSMQFFLIRKDPHDRLDHPATLIVMRCDAISQLSVKKEGTENDRRLLSHSSLISPPKMNRAPFP